MDKVLSARVDESVLSRIAILAQELHTTKKQVIESAISLYAERVKNDRNIDILDHTFGAWRREESVETTVAEGRDAFRASMTRHQK